MRILCCCAVILTLIPSCAPSVEHQEDLLSKGEFLCREQRWEEAVDALKGHLLLHPDDSGAHFYLGRCWLFMQEYHGAKGPWLVMAEGELETALRLFKRNGKRSTIPRFSDDYFELICHIERAKVFQRQLLFIADHPNLASSMPPDVIIEKLRAALRAAKHVDPDSPDVKNLTAFVRMLTRREADSH